MGVNLSKTSHIVFFAAIMPAGSFLISWIFYQIVPNPPFWLETITPLYTYIILYTFFENYAWDWRIFKLFKIVNCPNLRGRWEGKQRSSHKENGANIESEVCLEVKQTFSNIVVRAYYHKSESESVVANFSNLNGENYLFYTYDNDPNSFKSGTMKRHRGTTKLKYLPEGNELMGHYFNSIGNQGDMNLKWQTKKLSCKFKN